MRFDKVKIILVLICCFVGAGIIGFLIKRDSNPGTKDLQMENAGKNEFQESKINQNHTLQNKDGSSNSQKELEYIYDNIDDLEALSSELLEGDVGDVMDKIWAIREITSDFSDRERIAEVIRQFPIASDITVSEEQTELLRDSVTEMIFDNGNSDYDSYLNFLKNTGETVKEFKINSIRRRLTEKGISKEEIYNDPWELLSKDFEKKRSLWKGLISEGSNIRIFETQTSNLPIGKKLEELRGGIRYYNDLTAPPISLDEMLKKNGKVLMADVMFFIAHDDSTGGTVWPYISRYWFDTINNSWRVQQLALFRNRHEMYPISVLP